MLKLIRVPFLVHLTFESVVPGAKGAANMKGALSPVKKAKSVASFSKSSWIGTWIKGEASLAIAWEQ